MSIYVTFLGTGTSQGVPVIACDCEVCLSSDKNDKRLRSSVLIETQGKTLLVDTGPDFRQQMLRANVQNLDGILYTHEHKDHTAGLDDVRAFNFKHKKPMELFVDTNVESALKREYQYIFSSEKYPGIPQVNLNLIKDEAGKIIVAGVEVTLIKLMHYKLPIYGFRVGDFAYCTDTNYIAVSEMEKLKGLDVLVITALRKEKHISHFSLAESLEVIAKLQPKKAYLTHVSHLLGSHESVSKELPDHVSIATDNLKIHIS
jgi:phosphoribosyl 1,2-cyclic phosphate phosphodiesterase